MKLLSETNTVFIERGRKNGDKDALYNAIMFSLSEVNPQRQLGDSPRLAR
jgi:hypothetical protein